jgi:oligopeptide transport system substrate-binding protein
MKQTYFFFCILLFMNSCQSEQKNTFKHAGGTFTITLDNVPLSYTPHEVSDYYSSVLLTQVMEGLVSLDPKDLKIKPQLADSWEISDDGLNYTFQLRKNVYFHPHPVFESDKERLITIEDVVYSIEKACQFNPGKDPSHAYRFIYKDNLKGAENFYTKKAKKIEGLVYDANQITFQLAKKDPNFLYKLANIYGAVTSKKIHQQKGNPDFIGTGPYLFAEHPKSFDEIVLLKNENYYSKDAAGHALPYLDSVVFLFVTNKTKQLALFEEKKSDIILGLPTKSITNILEGRIKDFNGAPPLLHMNNNPLLTTHYYSFNMTDPRFSNEKVRQAFNLAVDKEKIGREILRNQYFELGYYGLVPPISKTFKGYDFEGVKTKGYTFQPEKAKKLLAEAGYANGKDFGEVTLRYTRDDINQAVADEFAKQIATILNINVIVEGSSFQQKFNDAARAKGDIFQQTWTGDYPNPESFLINFYGKTVPNNLQSTSYINIARYQNSIFDQLFEQARNSDKKTKAYELYAEGEKILLQNPPIIPLWYSGDFQIMYANIRNLHLNALNLFVFKEVYKQYWTSEEYQLVYK